MPWETFFVPSTAWLTSEVTAPEPSFLPADTGGWVVLNASPPVREASVVAVREQLLPSAIAALTTFQAARSVAEPPGLVGMYDPVNWRPVGSTSAADPASDRVEILRRVALRLTGTRPQIGGAPVTTGGWLENDDDPATRPTLTAEQATSSSPRPRTPSGC